MVKLSTRARYGTRALLELALHWGEGPIPLRDVAGRQEISPAYLARLLAPLVGAGIVRGVRGPRGGVGLARPPDEVRLSEVIGLLEGSIALAECVEDGRLCSRSGGCVTREVWDEMGKAMMGVLESATLQDLVERHREKEREVAGMYHI